MFYLFTTENSFNAFGRNSNSWADVNETKKASHSSGVGYAAIGRLGLRCPIFINLETYLTAAFFCLIKHVRGMSSDSSVTSHTDAA